MLLLKTISCLKITQFTNMILQHEIIRVKLQQNNMLICLLIFFCFIKCILGSLIVDYFNIKIDIFIYAIQLKLNNYTKISRKKQPHLKEYFSIIFFSRWFGDISCLSEFSCTCCHVFLLWTKCIGTGLPKVFVVEKTFDNVTACE